MSSTLLETAATEARPSPSRPAKTTFWYTHCPVASALSVAIRLGLLDEEFPASGDIAFTWLRSSADGRLHANHFSHRIDNLVRHGGNIPALWGRSEGGTSRLIGLSWVNAPYRILALPESGIRSVRDLKGKRLLVVNRPESPIDHARSNALRIYESALATEGLTLADVRLVELNVAGHPYPGGTSQTNASRCYAKPQVGGHRHQLFPLIRGEVDALAIQSFGAVELQRLLAATVVFEVTSLPHKHLKSNNDLPDVLTISDNLVRDRPDVVARFLSRLLQAEAWARQHGRETLRIIAGGLERSEPIVAETLGAEFHTHLEVDFAGDKLEALRAQKAFQLKHGFLGKDVDIDAWIAREPLEEARKLAAKLPAVRFGPEEAAAL